VNTIPGSRRATSQGTYLLPELGNLPGSGYLATMALTLPVGQTEAEQALCLSTLPRDLLAEIAEAPNLCEADLKRLMLTCRDVCQTVRPILEIRNARNSASAMMWACLNGDLVMVQRMLDLGVPIDKVFGLDAISQSILDPFGVYMTMEGPPNTPLTTAISRYRVEVVLFLLEHGANPNFSQELSYMIWDDTNGSHYFPLHWAVSAELQTITPEVENRQHFIINLLLDFGARLNVFSLRQMRRGYNAGMITPLGMALEDPRIPLSTVKLLLERGNGPEDMFKRVTHQDLDLNQPTIGESPVATLVNRWGLLHLVMPFHVLHYPTSWNEKITFMLESGAAEAEDVYEYQLRRYFLPDFLSTATTAMEDEYPTNNGQQDHSLNNSAPSGALAESVPLPASRSPGPRVDQSSQYERYFNYLKLADSFLLLGDLAPSKVSRRGYCPIPGDAQYALSYNLTTTPYVFRYLSPANRRGMVCNPYYNHNAYQFRLGSLSSANEIGQALTDLDLDTDSD
jgi:hypothetical protein